MPLSQSIMNANVNSNLTSRQFSCNAQPMPTFLGYCAARTRSSQKVIYPSIMLVDISLHSIRKVGHDDRV